MFICCVSAFCRSVFLSPPSFLGYDLAVLSARAAMGAPHPHWSHWDPGVGSPTSQLIPLGSRCQEPNIHTHPIVLQMSGAQHLYTSHWDPGIGSPASTHILLGSRCWEPSISAHPLGSRCLEPNFSIGIQEQWELGPGSLGQLLGSQPQSLTLWAEVTQIFMPQEHTACILSNKLHRLLTLKLWPLLFEWSVSKILSVRTFSERTILCIPAHTDIHRRIPARDVAHKHSLLSCPLLTDIKKYLQIHKLLVLLRSGCAGRNYRTPPNCVMKPRQATSAWNSVSQWIAACSGEKMQTKTHKVHDLSWLSRKKIKLIREVFHFLCNFI